MRPWHDVVRKTYATLPEAVADFAIGLGVVERLVAHSARVLGVTKLELLDVTVRLLTGPEREHIGGTSLAVLEARYTGEIDGE